MHQKQQQDMMTESLLPLVFGDQHSVSHMHEHSLLTDLDLLFGINTTCVKSIDNAFRAQTFFWAPGQVKALALTASAVFINVDEARFCFILIPTSGQCIVSTGGGQHAIAVNHNACLIPKGQWSIQVRNLFSGLIVKLDNQFFTKSKPISFAEELVADKYHYVTECRQLAFDTLNFTSLIKSFGRLVDEFLQQPQMMSVIGLDDFFCRILNSCLNQIGDFSDSSVLDKGRSAEKIAMICRYIDQNLSKSLTINDLVELSDLSARSIQYCFKKFFSCSPKRYILMRRLERAREMFASTGQYFSVTEVATVLRFSNLGNFSRLYQEAFGELPSQTLAKHARRSN